MSFKKEALHSKISVTLEQDCDTLCFTHTLTMSNIPRDAAHYFLCSLETALEEGELPFYPWGAFPLSNSEIATLADDLKNTLTAYKQL